MRSRAFLVRRPWLGLAALVTAAALVTVAARACGESGLSAVSCELDMTVEQGESCTVSGSNTTFSVSDEGMGCIQVRQATTNRRLFGIVRININNSNTICRQGSEGSVVENSSVAAAKNPDGSWTIRELYRG